MADDKPVAPDVPEAEVVTDTDKSAKRRLRSNGETVRERTQKQQQQVNKPVKPNFAASFIWGFLWPLRQLGKLIGKLGRFRVFRIIARILLPRYIRNSWRELRMVTWPNRRTSWKLTYAVIVFSIIFGVIVAIVDFALDKLFKELIIK